MKDGDYPGDDGNEYPDDPEEEEKSGPPVIVSTPEHLTVLVGKTAEFPCIVSNGGM